MKKYLVVGFAAAVALVGCNSGGDAASSTTAEAEVTATTAVSESTAPVVTTAAPVESTEAPSTTYDETTRIPLDQLEEKVGETLGRYDADDELVACVLNEIIAAYNDGVLSADDLDQYARQSTTTDAMAAFLQELQISGNCAT